MENNKTLIIMMILGLFFIIYIWFFNPKKEDAQVNYETAKQEEVIVAKTNKNNKIKDTSNQYELIDIPQNKKYDLIFENNNIKIEFDPHDAVIKHAWIKDTFLKREDTKLYDIVQSENQQGALRLKLGSWENEKTLYELTGGKNLYNYKRDGDTFTFICKFKKRIMKLYIQ